MSGSGFNSAHGVMVVFDCRIMIPFSADFVWNMGTEQMAAYHH